MTSKILLLVGPALVVVSMILTTRTGADGWWFVVTSALLFGGALMIGYGWRQHRGFRKDRRRAAQ